MATYAENLVTIRDRIASRLADVLENPKPDYSEDGRSLSWASYTSMLMQQLKEIEARIQNSSGPWEVQSRGIT